MKPPQTMYAPVGDSSAAYQVVGDGPIDLVVAPGSFSNLDVNWEGPGYAAFANALASFSRLILFDKRGTGLSDPLPGGGVPTLEDRMDDVLGIMKAIASDRVAFFGYGEGGPLGILFAATYPDRTSHLVLLNTGARTIKAPDYPWGWDPVGSVMEQAVDYYGRPDAPLIDRMVPSRAADQAFREWQARLIRASGGPAIARALQRTNYEIDVRGVLSAVSTPTLIMHRPNSLLFDVGNGRYLAEHIKGSQFVEVPGTDQFPWTSEADAVVAETQDFLTGTRPVPDRDRVLCTVLFTDIVDSTRIAASVGDRSWREMLKAHFALVRRELEQHRGREVDTTGDGFLAIFDGPARAIRCSLAIISDSRAIGLEVRAGVHTGECELLEGGVAGIAVHIAARVAAKAGAGEILASSTVKDLVAGSGIRFADRGMHTLKGVPDEWHLFAVEGAS
jgi:class 3 adenylate cyclase